MPAPPPPIMIFQFNEPINESVQIGDVVYYCPNMGHGGFPTVDNNITGTGIVRVGLVSSMNIVSSIYQLTVTITNQTNLTTPSTLTSQQITNIVGGYSQGNDFIMFSKDTETNRNSLLGYYAEVRLGNDSPDIAELFMVSTEAAESSK